jgi:disulfide bond formation protein DsbB
MNLPPCILCWYQRIAMYPLVIILGIGILRKDVKVWITALPLSIIGLFIAVYHNLLYYKLLPEALTPCVTGISCTTKLIELFGFLTIPLQALIAFVVITVVLIAYARGQRNE